MKLMEENQVNQLNIPFRKEQADNLGFFKQVDEQIKQKIENAK